MDNTELHYLTYDPDAIMEEMLLAYMDEGGDALYPGDEKSMLLNSVLAVMVQAFAGVDNALRMATLRYAVGDYLDAIGETRLCERIAAAQARAKVSIYEDNSGETRTLDAGLTIVDDNGMVFELENDVVLYGNGQTITADIISTEAGLKWNALMSGSDMYFMIPQSGVLKTVCSANASGGMDEETDDAFRERIRLSGATNITTGTALQYEAVAKGVSSDVIDVQAVNGGAGVVNVHLLIDEDATASTVIAAVQSALNGNSTRPLTDTVNVAQAVQMQYTIYVDCYTAVGNDISTAISDAKDEYIEWQNNTIGRAFNPDKLLSLMYIAGCERVVIDTTRSTFNSGAVKYTEIGNGKVCHGTVNVTRRTI